MDITGGKTEKGAQVQGWGWGEVEVQWNRKKGQQQSEGKSGVGSLRGGEKVYKFCVGDWESEMSRGNGRNSKHPQCPLGVEGHELKARPVIIHVVFFSHQCWFQVGGQLDWFLFFSGKYDKMRWAVELRMCARQWEYWRVVESGEEEGGQRGMKHSEKMMWTVGCAYWQGWRRAGAEVLE